MPEIVFNDKKKLGCYFLENHNSEPLILKRGQTIVLLTSLVVTQAERSQTPDRDTRIGGTVGDSEKAGWKADSVQSIENRQFY